RAGGAEARVTDLEGGRAELLKAGDGDPPSPVTVQAVRHERARRQVAAALGAVAAIGGLVILAVAALLGAFTQSTAPVTGTMRSAGGPSVEQLVHGKWVSMPSAPFRLCDPVSV